MQSDEASDTLQEARRKDAAIRHAKNQQMTSREAKNLDAIEVLGVRITTADSERLLDYIGCSVAGGHKRTILSGNVHALNLSYEQTWLRDYLNHADAVRLDGAGVRLGARLLGHRTPTRITWADFGWELAAYAAENSLRLFFLGSKPGIAEKAARTLQEKYPHLQVVGTHHGYFDKTPGGQESADVLQLINDAHPDIVIVGFGMPLQEAWLSHCREAIQAPVVMTGGAVFDYISGVLQRPSRVFTGFGLEWLGRMLIEPRRLWRRYLIGNPRFLWRILRGEFARWTKGR